MEDEHYAWLTAQYISLGHAAGMCEPGDEDEKRLRDEQRIVKEILRAVEGIW